MICIMAMINVSVIHTPISKTLLLSNLTNFSLLTPILFASLMGLFFPKVLLTASQLKSQQEAIH